MTPLILLHGLAGSTLSWEDVRAALPPSIKVEAIALKDWISHQTNSLTMKQVSQSLGNHLERSYPAGCVIAGHSMGGYLALEIAMQFPDLIRGLVLLNSSPIKDTEEARERRLVAIESIKANGKEPFLRGLMPKLFGERASPEALQQWKASTAETTDKDIIAQQQLIMSREDRSALLISLGAKALVIASEQDTITPPSAYQDAISELTALVLVENVGHHGPLQAPLEVAKAISNFYKSVTN